MVLPAKFASAKCIAVFFILFIVYIFINFF